MEPDYRKMYHHLMNKIEDALNLLIEAQRECEEMYLEATDDEEYTYGSSDAS